MTFELKHFPPGSEQFIDHPSQAEIGIHPFPDRLHVITMLSDPLRWRSRYRNYWRFEKMVRDAGAILYTAEVAQGDRPFEITERGNPHHLQLRTSSEIWHKENAQNLCAEILPPEAKYIAMVDADVHFVRSEWAQETMQLLQHYRVIQMYSHLQDVGKHGEPIASPASGFVWLREKCPDLNLSTTDKWKDDGSGKRGWGCPGLAWAYRRKSLNYLGGLIDWLLVGSADYYMAKALFGEIGDILDKRKYSLVFKELGFSWQRRALKHLHKNIGYMPGTALHYYHGPKNKRGYEQRPTFLEKTQFNPIEDLRRNVQGLYELEEDRFPLREGIRQLNRMRDEDS